MFIEFAETIHGILTNENFLNICYLDEKTFRVYDFLNGGGIMAKSLLLGSDTSCVVCSR